MLSSIFIYYLQFRENVYYHLMVIVVLNPVGRNVHFLIYKKSKKKLNLLFFI